MALLLWDSILSVNNNTIDLQHKQLIAMLNNFYDGVIKGDGIDNTNKVLKELQEYVVYHFSFEENILLEYGYPKLSNHIETHEIFVDAIFEFEQRIANNEDINIEIAIFIRDWIYNHIMIEDQEYSEFLTAKGVK